MSDLPHETPAVDEATALVTNLQQIREQNGYATAIWNDDRLTRAAQGLNEYRKIAEALPAELAEKLTNSGLQMCFLGIAPVEHFKTELSPAEVDQLNAAFAMRGEKYFVVSYPQQLSRHRNQVLVNADAAEAIMTENGDLFKGIDSPRDFLKNQPGQYLVPAKFITGRTHDQRHGVLAGYPRPTVDQWSRINNGLRAERFFRPKTFGVGDGREGFYFEGFNEQDKQWANEAIALKKATGIGQVIT